jgi:hypothetical protein
VNPGDVLRQERIRAQLERAARLLRRSAHLGAGAAVFGIAAAVSVMRDDAAAVWPLLGGAFALNWASHRTRQRARELM